MSFYLRKNSPCGPLHNIAKGSIPLVAAICRYLPLTILAFAANPAIICQYLPLAIPLFATHFNKLALFAADDVYRKLPIRFF